MVCLGESNTMTDDLGSLTNYRPELAGSPEKFFRVLDKIKEPERQEEAVRWGVENLFKAGKARFGCSTCECTWKENIQE